MTKHPEIPDGQHTILEIQIDSFLEQPGNQVVYGKPGKAKGRETKHPETLDGHTQS